MSTSAAKAFRQRKGKYMEEDQNSVNEEVAPHDQDSVEMETEQPLVDQEQSEGSHEPEDKQERNWKELRRKQREIEVKAKAQEEFIEKLLKEREHKSTPAQEPVVDEFADIDPDDFPTWKQTEKRIEKQAALIAEKKYQELRAREEQSRFAERLKAKYPDFQDVVNPDSISYLEQNEPELAETIAELKDPYKMGLQTYHYLKKANNSDDVSEKRHAKEVQKKIEKNENTIQSPQAYNKRPMAQAFHMTKAEKSKLYEEMMSHAGRAGSGY